ncbi:MAG TPA: hypothetical protein VLC46_11370 [Thermoanaerobaculia bacterium]|jgi:hypothetical protein|nr:hypothetical protein [Thermoanaerobaculia bacterium]
MDPQSGRERDVLTTPIDSHLPLIIALVLVCAWVVRGTPWSAAVQCAVPLLIVAMMTITDERTRLLAYGVIVAAAYGITAVAANRQRDDGISLAEVVLTIVGIVLLRWIPLHDVHIVRELAVMTGSIALLFAMPRRWCSGPALARLIAVLAVAIATPSHAGKMTLFPFALAMLVLGSRGLGVAWSRGSWQNEHRETPKPRDLATASVAAAFLVAAYFARYSLAGVYVAAAIVFLVPLLDRVRPLSYAAALVIFALWPWSGIIARALPIVCDYEPAGGDTRPIAVALAASEALPIPVPPHVRHAVVTASGGQMARLKPGWVVGTIEATDRHGHVTTRQIHIGDIADFGFTRRDQFFASRNPLPRFSPGEIRDYGANAWLWGAGRTAIACPADMASLRVVAAHDLPGQSHLQIDSIEFPAR